MSKVVTVGEILLRLMPFNKDRLNQGGPFQSFFGGAEANVSVSLSRYGHDVSFVTGLPKNEIGDAVVGFLNIQGVHTSYVKRLGERIGIYFYEEGFSFRQPNVIYDRKHSSFTSLKEEDLNWDGIFEGVDLFHITGITPALGADLLAITMKALEEAKNRNIMVSFDCNYRSKLWTQEEAKQTFLQIMPFVDICFAGYKDFVYLFGCEGPQAFNKEVLEECYKDFSQKYKIKYFACTNRNILSTSRNGLVGYLFVDGTLYESGSYTFDILDRIGAGDAYAAGILHGILTMEDPHAILSFGVGACVLKHMVRGDHNQYRAEEVDAFIVNGTSDVKR